MKSYDLAKPFPQKLLACFIMYFHFTTGTKRHTIWSKFSILFRLSTKRHTIWSKLSMLFRHAAN